MSGETGKYQLKPVGRAKLWWAVMGVAAVLLLPVGLNAAVPGKSSADYQPLAIDTFGGSWEIPVVTETGAPVMCDLAADDQLMKTWDCNGDTTVITLIVDNVVDPANTLQRMIRMGLSMEVPAGTPTHASADGTAHLMYVPGSLQEDSSPMALYTLPVVAVGQRGGGDNADLTAIAVISGESAEYYTSHIWSSAARDRGLPYQQELPVEIGNPWDELSRSPWPGGPEGEWPGGLDGEFPFDIEDHLDEFLVPDYGGAESGGAWDRARSAIPATAVTTTHEGSPA